MNDIININLYSDTQTRPSAGMLRAMGEAEVGDEQHVRITASIISVEKLDLLGKEATLFRNRTMCNQIAILVHYSQ